MFNNKENILTLYFYLFKQELILVLRKLKELNTTILAYFIGTFMSHFFNFILIQTIFFDNIYTTNLLNNKRFETYLYKEQAILINILNIVKPGV